MNRRGFIGRLLTFIPLFGLQRLFGASCLIPSSPIQSDQDNVLRIVKNIRTEIDCDVRMVQHIKGTISFRRLTSYVEKCKSLFYILNHLEVFSETGPGGQKEWGLNQTVGNLRLGTLNGTIRSLRLHIPSSTFSSYLSFVKSGHFVTIPLVI